MPNKKPPLGLFVHVGVSIHFGDANVVFRNESEFVISSEVQEIIDCSLEHVQWGCASLLDT